MSITDWDKRLLCPDGACVGVIGPTGTCKVCGRAAPNWGDDRRRGLKTTGELTRKPQTSVPGPEDEVEDEAADGEVDDSGLDDDEGEDAEDGDGDGDDDDGGDDGDHDDDEGDDDEDDDDDGDADGDDSGVVQAKSPAAAQPGAAKGKGDASDWLQRKLCPDGACVGVIGDNGKCKTCGASA